MLDLCNSGRFGSWSFGFYICCAARLNFKIISADIGGEVATSGEIEN